MPTLLQRVRAPVETMSPGYFSMVMATGILSLAAHLLGIGRNTITRKIHELGMDEARHAGHDADEGE